MLEKLQPYLLKCLHNSPDYTSQEDAEIACCIYGYIGSIVMGPNAFRSEGMISSSFDDMHAVERIESMWRTDKVRFARQASFHKATAEIHHTIRRKDEIPRG